jgi:uncharacterized protein YkwD
MLTTPWLLSRFGYRKTYSGAIWLLLAGGIAGGLSNQFDLVLAARVAEGLASGVVQPIPAIIILRVFASNEQGRASGIFGMGVVLAPALGPSIGGLLVDWFGWRSTFFMVVPFCLASLLMARRFIPVANLGDEAHHSDPVSLDWRGLLLATIATLCLLNAEREKRGLAPLVVNDRLAKAAQAYSRKMVRERFFAHVCPEGSTLKSRLRAAKYVNRSVRDYELGENLGWGTGSLSTPRSIVRAWMRSSGHRHSILNERFRDIGIGVAPGAPESVGGRAATYTTEFGYRVTHT